MDEKTKKNVLEAIRFLLFSISAGIIQAVSFTFFKEVFHLIYWPSYLMALILSVIWNFTINRNFNFKKAPNVPLAMMQIGLYYLIFTPISTYAGDYFAQLGTNAYLILFCTMFVNLITEFGVYKIFVFGKKVPEKKQNKVKSA
jgi:putative flippase GtrA